MKLLALGADRVGDMARLHAEAFDPPWSAEAFAALMDSPGVFALGTSDDSRLSGFILMRAIAGEAEVLTLAVAQARRRQGLACALLDAALALAAGAGAEHAFLEVAEDNPAALALYNAADFVPAGRRKGYYPRPSGPAADALLLRKTLTALDP